jgi:hypothetical protein
MSSSELQETKDRNFVGLAISPDEKIIAAGYAHGQLRLWQNPLGGDWPSAACAVAGRNMTPFEWKQYFGAQKYRRSCPDFPDGKELPSH